MKLVKPKFWDSEILSFWSIFLLPLTMIYMFFFWIRKKLNNQKNYKKPLIPIICVGNIYVGGTGKTPLVKEIFNITKSLGKNPAIIKKYYDYLNDEIEMLKETGKTYAFKRRLEGINQSILDRHDVAILDDGFQDFSIKPDLSIICFNSNQNIGNGFVMPSGPLRESLKAVSRADCIIINGDRNLEFEKKLIKHFGEKKLNIFYSRYKIKNIEKFYNQEITAFAGIGNPSNFFNLLKENNLNLIKTFSFPDHHQYSQKDFEKITNNNSTKIVTTEKDYYRLDKTQKDNCTYIKVDLEIENLSEFKNTIKSYL